MLQLSRLVVGFLAIVVLAHAAPGRVSRQASFFGSRRCSGVVDVCCRIPAPVTASQPTPNPVTSPVPTPKTPTPTGCGHRNLNMTSIRNTGSDGEAQFAEFPWMVAIYVDKRENNVSMKSYLGGGSLIHPSVVLTAAHRLIKDRLFVGNEAKHESFYLHGYSRSPVDLSVRAGEWNTQSESERIPYQTRDVRNIVIHDDFNDGNLYNDVALLILTHPFEIAPNVDVICLPSATDNFDSQRCIATGWGQDRFNEPVRVRAVLKKIDLPVVPHNICQTFLRKTLLGKYFELHDSFICAGGEPGKDVCTGDGGGPLVCPLNNNAQQYVQAGIISWGIGCGENQTPGVYTNVAKYRSWIDEQLRSELPSMDVQTTTERP